MPQGFLSRSSLSTHEAGQDGSICLDHSKRKETDTWDEVVKGLLILGFADFSLPAGIAEGAEPKQRVVIFLEKKIGVGSVVLDRLGMLIPFEAVV